MCFISTPSSIQSVTSISGINYVANNFGFFNNMQSIGRDSAFIIIAHRSLWNQAQTYKAYRDQTTGNKAILIDVDELADQFIWNSKHPLSIKNFIHFTLNSWTVAPPENLLLLGKSISGTWISEAIPACSHCVWFLLSGVPTSDQLLTSGIDGSLYEPKVPVGRVSAEQEQM